MRSIYIVLYFCSTISHDNGTRLSENYKLPKKKKKKKRKEMDKQLSSKSLLIDAATIAYKKNEIQYFKFSMKPKITMERVC